MGASHQHEADNVMKHPERSKYTRKSLNCRPEAFTSPQADWASLSCEEANEETSKSTVSW